MNINVTRKLDRKLFLIVKKDRPQFMWQFPQGAWKEGETLRDVFTTIQQNYCSFSL